MHLIGAIKMLHINGISIIQTPFENLQGLTVGVDLTVCTGKYRRASVIIEYLHACWIKSLASEAISCLETR